MLAHLHGDLDTPANFSFLFDPPGLNHFSGYIAAKPLETCEGWGRAQMGLVWSGTDLLKSGFVHLTCFVVSFVKLITRSTPSLAWQIYSGEAIGGTAEVGTNAVGSGLVWDRLA